MIETKIATTMRELTKEEIELVAGGLNGSSEGDQNDDIVCTGYIDDNDDDNDPWEDTWNNFYYDYYSDEYGGGGSGGDGGGDDPSGNGLNPEQTEKALNTIEVTRGLVQDIIEKYGPGTMLDCNGVMLPAWQVLEALGHLSDVLQAGNLIWGLETGDKGLADAIGFIAGIAAVGIAGELGAGIALAALLGIAVDKIFTVGSEQIAIRAGEVVEIFHAEVDEIVQNNPGPAFDPFNPGDWFDGLFGMPTSPHPIP